MARLKVKRLALMEKCDLRIQQLRKLVDETETKKREHDWAIELADALTQFQERLGNGKIKTRNAAVGALGRIVDNVSRAEEFTYEIRNLKSQIVKVEDFRSVLDIASGDDYSVNTDDRLVMSIIRGE